MNNQAQIMDKEKFLKWLDGEEAACLWEGPEGLMKYDMLVETINADEFAPDTPPVPTIKPGDKGFKCKACKETFSAYEWNLSTALYCGTSDVSPIETTSAGDAFFICPGCEKASNHRDLEVVE